MSVITFEEMKTALRRAVKERGEDFVYPVGKPAWMTLNSLGTPVCRYALDDGSPACIVGLALSYLCPLDKPVPNNHTIPNAYPSVSFSEGALTLAADVQYAQDRGVPWGFAVESSLKGWDS